MPARRLQNRLGKKQPFDSPEQAAALAVLYTGDRIANRLGRLFREHGLTNSQYNVLRILRGEGAPLPALEIASRTIQVVPAITGLIDRLEKQGLVVRHRCDQDRRVVRVELTKRAERLLSKIDAPLQQLHQELLGHLTKKDLAAMRGLLERAAERLDDG